MNRRSLRLRLYCLMAAALTACSTGAKNMTTPLDLTPNNLGSTLTALCTELTKEPTPEALAARLGKATTDPDNDGTLLLVSSPPAAYERIDVSIPKRTDELPRITMQFKRGQGPSATALAGQLGEWKTLPIEEHSIDLDQRVIFRKTGAYTCRFLAAVERPMKEEDRTTKDHIRELTVSAAKF